MNFADYMYKLRTGAGLSRLRLAGTVGVSVSTVRGWESGNSRPYPELIPALSRAFGVSEAELAAACSSAPSGRATVRRSGVFSVYNSIMLVFYGMLIAVSFIVDLSTDGRLSWAFVVSAASIVAFTLTNVPFIARKNRVVITLLSFFLALMLLVFTAHVIGGGLSSFPPAAFGLLFGFGLVFLPIMLTSMKLDPPLAGNKAFFCLGVDTVLLFALLAVYYGIGGRISYALGVAFPVAAWCITLPWFLLAVIRYLRVNGFFKTSLCLAGSAVYLYFMDAMLDMIIYGDKFHVTAPDLSVWTGEYLHSNLILFVNILLLLIAFVFAAMGIVVSVNDKRRR